MILSLHLLYERLKGADSRWSAYIELLPSRVPNVLHFDLATFQLLKGSPALRSCASFLRTTMKHYIHLQKLLAGPDKLFPRAGMHPDSPIALAFTAMNLPPNRFHVAHVSLGSGYCHVPTKQNPF